MQDLPNWGVNLRKDNTVKGERYCLQLFVAGYQFDFSRTVVGYGLALDSFTSDGDSFINGVWRPLNLVRSNPKESKVVQVGERSFDTIMVDKNP